MRIIWINQMPEYWRLVTEVQYKSSAQKFVAKVRHRSFARWPVAGLLATLGPHFGQRRQKITEVHQSSFAFIPA